MKQTTKTTQVDRIKADLLSGSRVDAVTAFKRYRITRLASAIKKLRDKGYPIITEREKSNGLAHYSLPEGWTPGARL